jgi:quercetin 2,3-dioxygenase
VQGIAPSYEQKHFGTDDKRGRLRLVASADGAQGSVRIHQDACVYAGLFDAAERASLALAPHRRAYVHVARGEISVNGERLAAGDGLKATDMAMLEFSNGQGAEVLVFDVPQS